MVSRATEDTITSILAEELRKKKIKAETFQGLDTPAGYRKPDLVCRDGGIYLLEAKFTERDLVEAIAKLQNDYIKHHKVLGIAGGFALLYPQKLAEPMPAEVVRDLAHKLKFKLVAMFPPKDPRSFRVDEGNIYEIVKILGEYILEPTKPVEPNIDFIIKSLRESATYLRNGLRYATAGDLEGFFGGRGVFENILQYEEKEYPIEELKSAAAFILVNQLLFYHVLAQLRPEFEDIDPDNIQKPSDLKKYFNKVIEIDYRPVFFYDVTPYIPESFVNEVKLIINVIKGLSVEKVGGDFLGTIFHDLIPFETRKSVAAFYTNPLAAELLAFLSIDDSNAQVADLAVGSGGLLVAAYRRKKNLLRDQFSEAKHRIFVGADILGIDVMPFAANIAACHLALQSPQYFTNRVRVAVWDSTELKPFQNIPSAAGLEHVIEGQTFLESFLPSKPKKVKGAVEVGREKAYSIQLNPCDVVIMNPPFTRQERFPKEYKDILEERFKDYRKYLHGQLGYHGYFILLADRFLKNGGRMALVLPATVLRVKSFEGIRKLWAEKYHVEYIVTTWHRSAFSESTMFREILLIAKKSKPSKDAKTIVTVLKKLPTTLVEAREMATAIKQSKTDWGDNKMIVKVYDYSKFGTATSNWFKHIAVKNMELISLFEKLLSPLKLKPLSSMYNITRGYELKGGLVTNLIVNSSQEKAIKSKDIWVLSREDKNSIEIVHKILPQVKFSVPKSVLKNTLRRASGLNKLNITSELDHIITGRFKKFEDFQNALDAKFSDKFWSTINKDVENRYGNFYIVRRLDLSAPGTCALAFYSSKKAAPVKLFWSLKVSDKDAKILSLWFNSTINLLQTLLLRAETRGTFMELSGYILDDFFVINPQDLTQKERNRLLKLFNKIQNVKLPSILDQLKHKHPARKLIDQTWLEILGYKGDTEKLLSELYHSLYNEIALLKKMMAEGAQ